MMTLILAFTLAAFSSEDSRLVKAVHEGTVKEVEALAKKPQELKWKDSNGNDALFYAVSLNDKEKTQALLASGASTRNLYSDKKESLLFEASRLGAEEIMDVLLKKDPSLLRIKNTDGESPLFEAVKENQSGTVSYLVKKGLSLKDQNKAGKTAMDYADPQNEKMTALIKKLKLTK